MSSVTEYNAKCPKCGKSTLFYEYNLRTTGSTESCDACGFLRKHLPRRDEKTGAYVTKDTEYSIEGDALAFSAIDNRGSKVGEDTLIPYDISGQRARDSRLFNSREELAHLFSHASIRLTAN